MPFPFPLPVPYSMRERIPGDAWLRLSVFVPLASTTASSSKSPRSMQVSGWYNPLAFLFYVRCGYFMCALRFYLLIVFYFCFDIPFLLLIFVVSVSYVIGPTVFGSVLL